MAGVRETCSFIHLEPRPLPQVHLSPGHRIDHRLKKMALGSALSNLEAIDKLRRFKLERRPTAKAAGFCNCIIERMYSSCLTDILF